MDKEPVKISPALMAVASAHVQDLNNEPRVGHCNMHSWSETEPDWWNGCCYTADHAQMSCMHKKGKEITSCWDSPYTGNTFENYFGGSAGITSSGALHAWKHSAGHNPVLLN